MEKITMWKVYYMEENEGKYIQTALFETKKGAELFVEMCEDNVISAEMSVYRWDVEIEK